MGLSDVEACRSGVKMFGASGLVTDVEDETLGSNVRRGASAGAGVGEVAGELTGDMG
jgi:hypothetical protein